MITVTTEEELSQLVVEHAMQECWHERRDGRPYCHKCKKPWHHCKTQAYATDPSLVVVLWQKAGITDVCPLPDSNRWRASFYCKHEGWGPAYGPTFEIAVCLAALRGAGIEVDWKPKE